MCGDFQVAAADLVASTWPLASNLAILTHNLPPTCGFKTLDHVLISNWISPTIIEPTLLHTGRSDHIAVSFDLPIRPCSLRGNFPSTVRPITAPERKEGPLEWCRDTWLESWRVAVDGKREDCEPDPITHLCTKPLSLPEPSSLTQESLNHISLGDFCSCVSHASEIYLGKFAKIDESKWSQHTGRGRPSKNVYKQLVRSRPHCQHILSEYAGPNILQSESHMGSPCSP